MKLVFKGMAAALLVTLAACNSVDQEAVTKAQSDLAAAQESLTKVESTGKEISETLANVNNATEGVKSTPLYSNIKSMVEEGAKKHEEVVTLMTDNQTKLQQLIADYSAGKIGTEAFKKQEEELVTAIRKSTDMLKKSQSVTQEAANMLQNLNNLNPQSSDKTGGQ